MISLFYKLLCYFDHHDIVHVCYLTNYAELGICRRCKRLVIRMTSGYMGVPPVWVSWNNEFESIMESLNINMDKIREEALEKVKWQI